MHIVIVSQSATDIALIARSLPAHDCHGLSVDQRAELRRGHAQLLIVDVGSAGTHLAEILHMAQAQTPAIPTLLLVTAQAADEVAALPDLLRAHALIDSEFKPLRRHAIAARVQRLLQGAYPGHDERQLRQFGEYAFASPAQMATHAGHSVALTQKEFELALLLFENLGRPLSRAYLQESIWGPEDQSELPTRTIDTHISRVRNKLELKPEHGFRLSTVYGYGYQLEQLAASVIKK